MHAQACPMAGLTNLKLIRLAGTEFD
ncbi:hypothetical protein KPLM21_180005 [Klebsiella pneumoniae]|nr:hypothetical protein KPSB59_190005 [Klebsiella quasipneumoniae subsp. quasipneumoniae]CDN05065.1 hypothetical protein SB30_120005 [Klebsiella quasipneumoniae subsp. similipneumoniae]CED73655.1 hypothetical protein KPLM21_180005 [Klebsiella pneumoniae]SBN28875.1 hypothetical protein KPMX200_30006 [Klebsiella pneumoniae]